MDSEREGREGRNAEGRKRIGHKRSAHSRPTTPARIAASASSRPARNCSASTVRRACARSATDWARSTVSIPSGWCPIRICRSIKAASNWSDAWSEWGAGGGTSTTAWPTRSNSADGIPQARCWKRRGTSLDPELQRLWLCGTGDEHITFTWRRRAARAEVRRQVRGHHSRAAFELSQHQEQDAAAAARKIHADRKLRRLQRRTAESASPRVTLTTTHRKFAEQPSRSLPEVCACR